MSGVDSAQGPRMAFIGGTGRCGTTVLKHALRRHPNIVGMRHEFRVIVDPDGALDLVEALSDGWSSYHGDLALQRFERLVRRSGTPTTELGLRLQKAERKIAQRLGLNPRPYLGTGYERDVGRKRYRALFNTLVEQLIVGRSRGSWFGSQPAGRRAVMYETAPADRSRLLDQIGGCIRDLYAGLESEGHVALGVEDTPQNLARVPGLFELFPESRFIHVLRDPRDVVLSYGKFAWGGGELEAAARRMVAVLGHWWRNLESVDPSRVVEVRLEDLCGAQEAEMRAMLAFVECPFDDAVMETRFSLRNVGAWRALRGSEAWDRAEAILAPIIARYGYGTPSGSSRAPASTSSAARPTAVALGPEMGRTSETASV